MAAAAAQSAELSQASFEVVVLGLNSQEAEKAADDWFHLAADGEFLRSWSVLRSMDETDPRRWAWEEFGHLEVGDSRRRDRVVAMARRLAGFATGRVSRAFANAAERQGAYDLLESGRVPVEAIVAATSLATVERSEGEYVFVPIDSTTVHVVDRERKTDLGLVGTHTNDARGLNVVTALSVSLSGTTLGISAQTWWVRPPQVRQRKPSTYQPVEQRESRFTVQTVADVAQRYASAACKPWVVIDRGGDAVVIIDELLRRNVRFTVRASWNRRIAGSKKHAYVRDCLNDAPVRMRYKLAIPQSYQRSARSARLQVRAGQVRLNFSHDWQARRENPTINVLLISEQYAPVGEKPLDWMLYTTAPIETPEQIALVIKSYVSRWRIEDFHKTWKSGHCDVEQTQLRSAAAVKTWASLLAIVAARIERLRYLARNEPEKPASVELSHIEIEALKLLKNDQKKRTETIPDEMPTIATAVGWIADIGGYTGKSSGGPPGATTIAQGMSCLAIAVRTVQAMRGLEKKR